MRALNLIAVALAFAVLPTASAGAQTLDELLTPGDPAKLATAFKAICLDQPAPDAQTVAALAPPWNFKRDGPFRRTGNVYAAWPLQLIVDKGKVPSCTLTSSIPDDAEIDAVAPAITPLLGLADAEPARAPKNGVRWVATVAGVRSTIAFQIQQGSGIKIGTLTAMAGEDR